MKKTLKQVPTIILAICLLLPKIVSAQAIWQGTNNITVTTNWSDSVNWSTGVAPSGGDAVKFLDNGGVGVAGTVNNVVDSGFGGTVGPLQYANTNSFHTTLIVPGVSLNPSTLSVGTGANNGIVTNNVAITGTNGAILNVSGASIGVSQGSNGKAVLDLSTLDTLTANVTTLGVGAINYPATDSSDVGSLSLARTNTLTITGNTTSGSGSGVQSGFLVGDPRTSGPTAGSSILLGRANTINANLIVIGARKGGTSTHIMSFNPSFTNANPVATFRASDGVSPVPSWSIGDDFFASGGSTACNGLVNFSGGTVDALVAQMIVGRGQGGAGNRGTGTLTFSAGTMNVGTLQVGYQSGATAANGPGTGTVNVNGTATLSVTTNLELTHITTAGGSAAGSTVGILNVNGGSVFANNIIAGGGGNSTLTMTNGLLVLTNTCGTPALAISTLAISNSTLRLTGFATPTTNIVTTNFVCGGATNRINIDLLPTIGSYPATFKLIKYSTQSGLFNAGLGTLPAASPAYAGYVTNNSGAGSVDLVITAGPAAPVTPLAWTAANSGDWDTVTTNWSNLGTPSKYSDGSPVRFDDTAANGSVNLTAAFGPASTTVSNNALNYTFSGSGSIGAGSLVKQGTGILVLDNTGNNGYSAGTLIAAGTLQIGNSDSAGSAGTGNITNNGTLIFNRANNVSSGNIISGSGTLVQNGAGTLTLSGANTYSGLTLVNNGTLVLNGSVTGGGLMTNAAGTTLGGNGTNTGPVAVSGQLAPGTTNTAGTFGGGSLAMDLGATVAFDVSANSAVGNGVNDLLQVNGNLALNNNALTVNLLGAPTNGSVYRVANYTGSLSGAFNPTVTINGGSRATATLDYGTANQVNLSFANFGSLIWNSTGSAEWDNGASQSWSNTLTSVSPDFFYPGDAVLFDDTPGVVTSIDLASGVAVLPSSIINNSTNNNFSITGSGKITGSTGLIKKGPGTLVLGTSNDFTGNVVISDGTLKLNSVAAANFALGVTNVPAIVTNTGTLDINGFGGGAGTRTLGGKTIIVSGAGYNGQGAIINSSGSRSDNAVANVTLAGDATLAANGTAGGFSWNIRDLGSGSTLSTGGKPFSLTILGPARLSLFSVRVDTALSNIDVQSGQFELGDNTSGLGNPTNTLTVEAGATLSFLSNSGNTTSLWNKVFILNGNGSVNTVQNRGGNGHTLIGPVQLNGSCIFSGNLTNLNAITGPGSLTRLGGGALYLFGTNTYTGDTTVSAGTLALAGNGVIQGSTNIVLNNSTIDAGSRGDNKLTLFNNQVLSGTGTINGSLSNAPGSIVTPGLNGAIGKFTVTTNARFNGTVAMKLDPDNGTNDVIVAGVGLVYGGTLSLTNLSAAPLSAGMTFKLFNAATYSGSFTLVPSTPGPDLAWANTLASNGTLGVVPSNPTPPRLTGLSLTGTTLTISATNGANSGQYTLLQSTNLATPLSQWQTNRVLTFDANGNLTTNLVDVATNGQTFYILKQ
jgi:fibronectin-binding autotransporter adhesin